MAEDKKVKDRDERKHSSEEYRHQLRARELLGDALHGVSLGGVVTKEAATKTKKE